MLSENELRDMSRKDLQALAKSLSIKANQSNNAIIECILSQQIADVDIDDVKVETADTLQPPMNSLKKVVIDDTNMLEKSDIFHSEEYLNDENIDRKLSIDDLVTETVTRRSDSNNTNPRFSCLSIRSSLSKSLLSSAGVNSSCKMSKNIVVGMKSFLAGTPKFDAKVQKRISLSAMKAPKIVPRLTKAQIARQELIARKLKDREQISTVVEKVFHTKMNRKASLDSKGIPDFTKAHQNNFNKSKSILEVSTRDGKLNEKLDKAMYSELKTKQPKTSTAVTNQKNVSIKERTMKVPFPQKKIERQIDYLKQAREKRTNQVNLKRIANPLPKLESHENTMVAINIKSDDLNAGPFSEIVALM